MDIEDEAAHCEACAECAERREDVSAGAPSWEHIPTLATPDELARFPALTTTQERHIADPDGIQARYHFETEVKCSLKGEHRHKLGVVVKTLCELVLCMGTTCGRKSIVGFDDILGTIKARSKFEANRMRLADWAPRFAARIEALRKPLAARIDLRETLREHLPDLHAELARRASAGARGREVFIGVQTHELRGLALFRGPPPKIGDLEKALAAFRTLECSMPPVDGPSAEALAKLAASAERKADAVEDWVAEGSRFLTVQNARLALVALGHDAARCDIEGRQLRVSYLGRSALLGLPDATLSE